jgi:hypothetical protein
MFCRVTDAFSGRRVGGLIAALEQLGMLDVVRLESAETHACISFACQLVLGCSFPKRVKRKRWTRRRKHRKFRARLAESSMTSIGSWLKNHGIFLTLDPSSGAARGGFSLRADSHRNRIRDSLHN